MHKCIDAVARDYGRMVSSICRRTISDEEVARDAARQVRAKEKNMVGQGKQRKIFTGLCVFAFVFVSQSFAETDVKMIDTAQLHSMIVDNAYSLEAGREKHFTVIDARTREAYDEAHIFSAISIPVRDFEKLIGLLPKDNGALLVVYCNDTKFETSKIWAGKAATAGYANVVVYSEGFSAWKKKKMPTISPRSGL